MSLSDLRRFLRSRPFSEPLCIGLDMHSSWTVLLGILSFHVAVLSVIPAVRKNEFFALINFCVFANKRFLLSLNLGIVVRAFFFRSFRFSENYDY